MKTTIKRATVALALAGAAWPALAAAQSDDLIALGKDQLRTELLSRHDAAVTAMAATVGVNDPRYIWAMQAKVQCGIALGFLKSGTKDPGSIRKCADAYARMQQVPMAPVPMAPPSTVTPEICRQPILGTVFFDWDSVAVPDSSIQTLQFVATNMGPCGWTGLNLTGHADRSGSDAYNEALSLRRAAAVAAALASAGVSPGVVATSGKGESEPRVPTADGIREAQNRRVEITAR
ncbi:OmpA family protein [Novosphingobium sp. Gsoil 351]|uniref:OmpA family protein n=1 Tax=Novosphingobium sp. Gsoil 351 TaxID=2675225 RepID=UPI0012B46CF4|nr:OmpA family protein [Novosphingobium sp. Gsoil 351]QGN54356.1 OmpA family protein [Novosphingobium sp. Gsoil 351]